MPSRAVETPIGTLGLVGSDAGLSNVRWSAKGLPDESCPVLDDAAAQLDAYFVSTSAARSSSGSAGSRSRRSPTARP